MGARHHSAVIFDVDGPLLDLTTAEEDAYFEPFREIHGLENLSRDWDAYRVRNDIEIYREIYETHLGRSPGAVELERLTAHYLATLSGWIEQGRADVVAIPGAQDLVARLAGLGGVALGTATANLQGAARIRLERAGMWRALSAYPGAAERGGPKRDVLASVIAELELPPDRIVFLGDNLNDLDAGRVNGVHFVGFHVDSARRERLRAAGAEIVAGDHAASFELIRGMLRLA